MALNIVEKLQLWMVKKNIKPLSFEMGKEFSEEAKKMGLPSVVVRQPLIPEYLVKKAPPKVKKILSTEFDWSIVSNDDVLIKIFNASPIALMDAPTIWLLSGKDLELTRMLQLQDLTLRMRSLFLGYDWRDITGYWEGLKSGVVTKSVYDKKMKKEYGFSPFELYSHLLGIPILETPEDYERVASVQAFLLQQLPPELIEEFYKEKKIPFDKTKKVMSDLLERSRKKLEEVVE